MKRKLLLFTITLVLVFALVACQGDSEQEAEAPEETSEEVAIEEGVEEEETEATDYKIGYVTPTLTTSEDEFRAVAEMVEKYPDFVVHATLPENFNTDIEGCISQITSLADRPDIKAIAVSSGQVGLIPAFQKIREERPDIIIISQTNDDPEILSQEVDMAFNTDWIRRGYTIPKKAKEMGAETFVHYSFPTHLASETVSGRKELMEQTCEELGMEWVEELTPDPQTGDGPTAMLQFLREDIPRKIEKYGPDTNIFGSNCPMYDVILDEAFKLKFIVAEQCCPTPTQAYPSVLNLEISEEDLGDYDKINSLIEERATEAGMNGRLSGWAMPSSVYGPQFIVELTKYILDNDLEVEQVLNKEFLDEFSVEHMDGIGADFEPVKEGIDNYYLFLLDDIYY